MRLSVIIPARNAAADLEHLLQELLPQMNADDECIVVDDASSDATSRIATRFSILVERLDAQRGAAAARNAGVRSTTGDILVFLDSDVLPHADVLERFRAHFRNDPELAAVFGAYDEEPFSNAAVSRFRNLLHCYTHRTGNHDAFTFWAGCGAMRRSAFEDAGGFDSSVFGIEDIELGVRVRAAGRRILLDPSVEVQHRKVWTLASFVRTDIWLRAVPWSMLLLSSGDIPSDLNLKLSQRVSVAATSIAAVLLPLALLQPWIAGSLMFLLLAIVIALNLPFYRFLARCGGVFFAIQSIPLHLLHYLCGALGFAIAAMRLAMRRRQAAAT
jgi:cellulose synthase/poly-beta-1,6-N-acetylglucosamine synthase-like glycosyltransferase